MTQRTPLVTFGLVTHEASVSRRASLDVYADRRSPTRAGGLPQQALTTIAVDTGRAVVRMGSQNVLETIGRITPMPFAIGVQCAGEPLAKAGLVRAHALGSSNELDD